MKRYFMTIREACRLTLEAATQGKGGCIFILDMGEEISIVELAEQMIRLSGLKPHEDIPIVFSGLRPGEKLHEKLWYDYEKPERTIHEKVFVAKPNCHVLENYEKDIAHILTLARRFKIDAMLEKIKEVVPEFEYTGPAAGQSDRKGKDQVKSNGASQKLGIVLKDMGIGVGV